MSKYTYVCTYMGVGYNGPRFGGDYQIFLCNFNLHYQNCNCKFIDM